MPPRLAVAVKGAVEPDEPCYAVTENNALSEDFKSLRRWQRVYVVREDDIREYKRDLGPAADFTAPEFRIVSLLEDSVAFCLDQADQMRLGDDYWVKRKQEIEGESTLVTDFITYAQERELQRRNISTFGRYVRRERNH